MPVKSISIAKAKSGMILAKPVLDDKGRILCNAPKELTQKLLLRFENMGISTLYVESNVRLSNEEYIIMRDDINKRFSKISDGSILFTLKEILLKRLDEKRE